MGRDPEATDEGATGRGVLTTLVGDTSVGFSRDVRDAQARAIRSILDEAYTAARRTLIAEMPRLRDVAAYLYEQERIDGDEFEAVMAGRLRPADADGWRAAAASPRPWDAIPTIFTSAHRAYPRCRPVTGRGPRVAAVARLRADATTRHRPGGRQRATADRPGPPARPAPRSPAGDCRPCPAGSGARWRRSCATSPPTRIAERQPGPRKHGGCRTAARPLAAADLTTLLLAAGTLDAA